MKFDPICCKAVFFMRQNVAILGNPSETTMRSQEDLNYPNYINRGHHPLKGYSPPYQPLLGYSSRPRRRACHRKHIFLSRTPRLGTPFKVLWTIVKGSDLNIGAVCGDSYSRNKKRRYR
ncbi:hypothetical protein PIB30_057658 [Stylosanthes scabra]|uniref:Uncharacterized protein n=1 Tax=Stylosanthes scabra TaxID=79078 RepID=A0ABU6ZIG3_9FABA|nr:hypothetical protein [Stylosanthes scabra]